MCFFVIPALSVVRSLFRSFVHSTLLVFLPLRFEILICFIYQSSVGYVICEYFILVFSLFSFVLLTLSLAEKKVSILNKLNLSLFFLLNCAFCVKPKNCLLNPRSRNFSSILSSKYLIVLCFIFGVYNPFFVIY